MSDVLDWPCIRRRIIISCQRWTRKDMSKCFRRTGDSCKRSRDRPTSHYINAPCKDWQEWKKEPRL